MVYCDICYKDDIPMAGSASSRLAPVSQTYCAACLAVGAEHWLHVERYVEGCGGADKIPASIRLVFYDSITDNYVDPRSEEIIPLFTGDGEILFNRGELARHLATRAGTSPPSPTAALCLPTADDWARLRPALRTGASSDPVIDLDGLVALRERLSGVQCDLAALRQIFEGDQRRRERFFGLVLPDLLRRVSALEQTPSLGLLPLLDQNRPGRVRISRDTAASLLAAAFLGCLPPQRYGDQPFPRVDFTLLLDREVPQEVAKLCCILDYFERISEGAPASGSEPLQANLVITRRVLARQRSSKDWLFDSSPLGTLRLHREGGIEDATGAVHVDFANRFLGGGVLSGGCVQEEIMFAECPELIAAMLFASALGHHETLRIQGVEPFARTVGYAYRLRYAGPVGVGVGVGRAAGPAGAANPLPLREVIAMDATRFDAGAGLALQLEGRNLLRDLNKAYCGFGGGFPPVAPTPIATGNWGCGAFGGDPELKAILQWLAASATACPLEYYSFGDRRLDDLEPFVATLRERGTTVSDLWRALLSVAEHVAAAGQLADVAAAETAAEAAAEAERPDTDGGLYAKLLAALGSA